jgi:hypothetical protein
MIEDNQSTMSAIDFNDFDQVFQLRKLAETIQDNLINAEYIDQPFYIGDEECEIKDFVGNSVYIELFKVNGVRIGEHLYMYVNQNKEQKYLLLNEYGERLCDADSIRWILDYTTCRDGICVFGGCDMCIENYE